MSLPIHRISSARFLRAPKSEFTSSKHATETPRKTTISYVYHEPVLGRTAIMFAIDTRWTQKNHCESNASKRREENLKLPTMEPMRTVHLALFYYNFRFFFLSFSLGWAAGHWLLFLFPKLRYLSVQSNHSRCLKIDVFIARCWWWCRCCCCCVLFAKKCLAWLVVKTVIVRPLQLIARTFGWVMCG